MRSQETSHLHRERARAYVGAPVSYPENLAQMNDADGYSKQQIFCIGEMPLYWKKAASTTVIAREKSTYDSKLQRTGELIRNLPHS